MWGALISGGLSLLSGLGSRQSAKKQQKMQAAYEYQNYLLQENVNQMKQNLGENVVLNAAQMAKDWGLDKIPEHAANAGFNPVTWLNANAGTYGAMLQAALQYRQYGENLQIDQPYMQNAPTAQVPSMMEVLGNAGQAAFNTWQSDQRVLQSQDFQREMLGAQIAAIQRNGGRPLNLGKVPATSQTFFGSGSIPYAVTAGGGTQGRTNGLTGGLISVKPHEVTATDSRTPYSEPGYMPEVGLLNTYGGGLAPAMSKDTKDRLEEDIAGTIGWNIRNRLVPSLGLGQHGNLPPAPWGYEHYYSPWLQEYQLRYRAEQNYRDGGWGYRVPEKGWTTGGSF